jgi:hypothetical protein
MAKGKSKSECKSDSAKHQKPMPKQPVTNVFGTSKTRTGNISGPKHS